jgi:hypothetical protein
MPQELYAFGFHADQPTTTVNTPNLIYTTAHISILWASWCDLIYATHDENDTWHVFYNGKSLNESQKEEFSNSDSYIIQSLKNPQSRLSFFGNTMHDGVRGYITRTDYPIDSIWGNDYGNAVGIFGTDAEAAILPDAESWTVPLPSHNALAEVRMCSDNSLLLAIKDGINEDDRKIEDGETSNIISLKDVAALKTYCNGSSHYENLASFQPAQLVLNAVTATALDKDGKVYTRTADPRYPSCLGRPYTDSSKFEPVPYLSETRVTKIASGGYMTAAISEDGELFLWGQANPGTDGELGALHRLNYESEGLLKETFIWGDTEQDEYIKCLNIHINGEIAIPYDVAIGFGHILVAAKVNGGEHVVFAAGCGSEGQLGLGRAVDFLEDFEELVAFRGKQIVQLVAAGWSSFVVKEE